MFKVPNDIRDKMHRLASLSAIREELLSDINDFFYQHISKTSGGRFFVTSHSGNEVSLEDLEYGKDITDVFCKILEDHINSKYDKI